MKGGLTYANHCYDFTCCYRCSIPDFSAVSDCCQIKSDLTTVILAVSAILNPWAASHEKLAFAILYLLTAFSILSWISALRRKWQEHQYYKAMKDDMSFQIFRARQRGIPLDSVHFDSQGNMRYNNSNNIVE